MDWPITRYELLGPSSPPVPQHSVEERWTVPCPEALWTPNTIQDTLPAHRRAFAPEWQQREKEAEQQAAITKETTLRSYNQHAHSLPDITIGSHVAIHNQDTKLWDRYGVVVDVGKHRQYFIKTTNGRVLVRNRRFLRRRVPTSLPEVPPPATGVAGPTQEPPPPRRSTRARKPTERLIEDFKTFHVQANHHESSTLDVGEGEM